MMPRSPKTFLATNVALRARGMPQYTAECTRASTISSGVNPIFSAALICMSSSCSHPPRAASIPSVTN